MMWLPRGLKGKVLAQSLARCWHRENSITASFLPFSLLKCYLFCKGSNVLILHNPTQIHPSLINPLNSVDGVTLPLFWDPIALNACCCDCVLSLFISPLYFIFSLLPWSLAWRLAHRRHLVNTCDIDIDSAKAKGFLFCFLSQLFCSIWWQWFFLRCLLP